MEATNTNHASTENAKSAEKLLTEASSNMMDIYNKQLKFITDFYSNFFNAFTGNSTGWDSNTGFSNNFLGNDLTKLFSNPFNGIGAGFPNPFLQSFDKLYKQMMEYNNNIFSNLNSATKSKADWSEISKKYQETIENRLGAFNKIFSTLSEACGKKMNFSMEINKKEMEDVNNQLNLMLKQNQKIWSDMFAIYSGSSNTEEKKTKDPIVNEIKKRPNVPVYEFKDHKV